MAGHPRHATRSPPLSSHLPAQARGGSDPSLGSPSLHDADPFPRTDDTGLARFNALSPEAAHSALLHCCGSRRWAHRVAAHRPYPDFGALLAAADEASYDLSQPDLSEALACEFPPELEHGAAYAAILALDAAHGEYERTFGHAFVICLDGTTPEEQADQLLAAIRRRMELDLDEERAISADELRRVAQVRLADLTHWLTSADGVSAAEFGLFAPVG
ncbi:2-oxo-4-hydroxy-4-carboxy-5-ureidoimidazoline decarboxylase [Streptomyces sp. NPDC002082]|uniref:2-oxo-4-hydroxy-4-carboxy-5-ureidoimidazoline decarboxylase n=1 Tax=Streptomyces sp. NPDC002082 TaxID=3154772 RepID=UPI003328D021